MEEIVIFINPFKFYSDNMVKRTGPTDINLRRLISKMKGRFWKRIAKDLTRPRRIRRTVNLSRISKYSKNGETIMVTGKVLSVGVLEKKINLCALSFSEKALEKIKKSGSKIIEMERLLKDNPKGKGVKIIG